ncbi:GM16811 [Drosophila sechellia]|uniref:GM16811 n=1 Tax=Drosophila sechellia TaxID=7238 RepID=B4ID79_DROSE|nr:GM16811 [Drosophila sechellia]
MKLMPQTLHGHVLHETADAKKQQPGQQLVHEAPQWVGAQKERVGGCRKDEGWAKSRIGA